LRALARLRVSRYNVPVPSRRRLATAFAVGLMFVVLSFGGGALGATSSGANGDIAYVRGADVYRLSTGTVLVSGASDPSWSPDGTKLAFVQGGAIMTCSGSRRLVGLTRAARRPRR